MKACVWRGLRSPLLSRHGLGEGSLQPDPQILLQRSLKATGRSNELAGPNLQWCQQLLRQ